MVCTEGYNHVSLVKLVSSQKWYLLEVILQCEKYGHQNMPVFDDRRANSRLPEEHILHLACKYQAPFQTIVLLADKFPESVSCAENKGRYPIHIACAKGLEPKVIDFLIKLHPQTAGVQDTYGKSPLHYTCESYADNFGTILSNAYNNPEPNLRTVVSLLLNEVPESANMEDLDGSGAIEYAIGSGVDIGVIKFIQKASRENWRTMKKDHQGQSHEELRHSLDGELGSLSSSNKLHNVPSENLANLNEVKDEKDISTAMHIDTTEANIQAARTA